MPAFTAVYRKGKNGPILREDIPQTIPVNPRKPLDGVLGIYTLESALKWAEERAEKQGWTLKEVKPRRD